ncbi:replicative DNA helicase [Halosquirtibacter xylanolyticus]|uniref:replicative DNA helicase n=1 Tax=Halosquirtibacter xylanolyticus TaxID=3374599 RepID=UPI00374862C0|nr:replicative DNA helicase [Prolixibacteraceae bacterium]
MAVQRQNNIRNSNAPSLEQIEAQYGKLPPQAVEVEEAVLGALMLERDAYVSVADMLQPECFYKDEHQRIFKVIKDLNLSDKPIDLLMVTQALRDKGELDIVGGPLYITQLTSKVASAAHIEFHARIIAQKHIQRELIHMSSEIQTKSYQDSVELEDLIDFAESSLFKVTEGNISKESVPVKPVIAQAIETMRENSVKPEGMSGVPSGFTSLDRITSGWQKTDMIIIAARPAMGKTAFVLSMARNIAVEHQKPTAVFSLEMSSLQLVNRLIAAETGFGSEKIKTGKLEEHQWGELHSRLEKLTGAPLFIDDTPALSVYEFRAKCRRLKSQHNIGCVIVDYLQLMTTGGDAKFSREQEVSTISRNLKAIAKEIDVPIIALSQLSRAVESREGRRPQLSDLRESGAIEQDADMVLFIHRPEYYGITEDADGNNLQGIAELIIAKHRNGATGDVQLRFESSMAKFSNLDDPELLEYASTEALDPKVNVNPGQVVNAGQTFSSKMNSDIDSSNSNPQGQDLSFGGFDFPTGNEFDDTPPF